MSVSGKVTVSRSGRTGSASGSGAAGALLDVRELLALDDLELGLGHHDSVGSIGTVRVASRLRAKRQLDAQDPVLVGCPRGLGDDVGAEANDPPERAALDLDLLVDPALGFGHGPLTGDHELAPADLERDPVELHARQLGPHDRLGLAVVAVVEVDAGREARLRGESAPRTPSPQTSPKSSSISRRMRSKFDEAGRAAGPQP